MSKATLRSVLRNTNIEEMQDDIDDRLAYAKISERRKNAMIKRIRKANRKVVISGKVK